MTTEDDEQPLTDVNKPSKSVIEEDKLVIEVTMSEEQCESSPRLVESNLDVVEKIAETVSLEDNPVSPANGKDTILGKPEATVEMTENPAEAEEGSDEIIDGKHEEHPLGNEADAETKVVLGTAVTDTTRMEHQLERAAEGESMPAVVAQLQAVVTQVSQAPQPETAQMDTRGDTLDKKKELTGEGDYETDMVVDVREKIEEVSGDNELIDSMTNKSEMVVEGGESELVVKDNEEDVNKGDADVNISDAGIADISSPINGESVIIEVIPSSEVKLEVHGSTEFNANVVDNSEQLKLSDETKDIIAEMSNPAETNGVAAELLSETQEEGGELLNNTNFDKRFVVENKNVAVAEEEHLEGDVNMDAGMEELASNIQLEDAVPITDTGDETGADKVLDCSKMETDEGGKELDNLGQEMDESPEAPLDEEDEIMSVEDEGKIQETEMETETDVNESGKASGGKRKRGKLSKSPPSSKPAAKSSSTVGEDVCFICFDGGDLFLCDRRGCPKAYHPSCVNRDEAFFRAKGRWNCGWHMCSICEKNPRYMCYTCTFSLCKSCTKDAVIMIVRENKGFCETCLRTVTLIENNEQGNKDDQIDFDDKSSWEYLFKDYYLELKAKLSLTSVEIADAKNPWKGTNSTGSRKQESSGAPSDTNDKGSGTDDSTEKSETIIPKRRKLRKQSKPLSRKEGLRHRDIAARNKAGSMSDKTEWASNELLEFVSHMKDGDTSILSQFEVQALLLEYIKRNKLRDPRRKSHIICDTRFQSLFGKSRVGHFEMLKLLESHFLSMDEQNDDVEGSVVDTDNNQLDNDDDADLTKSRRRKARRRSDLVAQSNLDDYAAVDMHNISLIYLRRKLMEDLLDHPENFHDKAVGTFVRIRISGSTQKQDLYRLVQVVGTSKAADPYKVGKKNTDIMVEILNLDKTEVIAIDTISNQEFTEEECKRLRQSIKCGLISRLTVGEILEKTMEIQEARINDWMESEVLRLSHLRDRASDLGRRKELRECVEKLQLLKTPEERHRRLEEIPRIHDDPKMDPTYESDENETDKEDTRRDAFMRSKGISRRGRVPTSAAGDSSIKDSWSKNWEPNRNQSGNNFSPGRTHANEIDEDFRSLGDKVTPESTDMEKLSYGSAERISRLESYSSAAVASSPRLSSPVMETGMKINESEKMWHYKDPSGKEQGPFSMVQLRKWNNTGYFPSGLKIWRNTDNQDNSIPLAEALAGKFPTANNSKLSSSERWPRNEISSLPSPTPKAIQSPRVFSSPSAGSSNSITNNNNMMTPPNNVSNSNVLQPGALQAVQNILSQNDIQGWTSTTVQQQPQVFPTAAMSQQDFWSNAQGNQPNVQQTPSTASTNVAWGPVQANPNMGYVGWGPVQANPNLNAGWAAAPGGTVPTVQVTPGSWVPTTPQVWGASQVHGPIPVNGWVPPGGNAGPAMTANGWGSPVVNTTNQPGWGVWDGGEQNNGSGGGGGQFSGGRDSGGGGQFSGGRDGGSSGGRPYYRQSSFGSGRNGGGSGQYGNKREIVCPYNSNQRCRKGANCEYLHV